MKRMLLPLAALVMAAAPLSLAHNDGTFGGGPKFYCEDWPDTKVHDYTDFWPSTGPAQDGSGPICPPNGRWDEHREWRLGGAMLPACDTGCWWGGAGAGSYACYRVWADHPEFPHIYVDSLAWTIWGQPLDPIQFVVGLDTLNNIPKLDPNEPECGDGEVDYVVHCFDHCGMGYQSGLDGAYHVYVISPSPGGHVWTT